MISGRTQHSMRSPSLLASGIGPIHQRAETDSRELRRKRSQIWDIVLDAATPRHDVPSLRHLHDFSGSSELAGETQSHDDSTSRAECTQHGTVKVGDGENLPKPTSDFTKGCDPSRRSRYRGQNSVIDEVEDDTAYRERGNCSDSALTQRRSLQDTFVVGAYACMICAVLRVHSSDRLQVAAGIQALSPDAWANQLSNTSLLPLIACAHLRQHALVWYC